MKYKFGFPMSQIGAYWWPIGLFVFGLVFRYFWVDVRDLCIDEPFSVYHAQKSPAEIIRFSVTTEPNPPLYMLLLHFVMQLFGDSVVSVRSLSVIFSSLTGVLLFSISKRFSNVSGGLIAWALFTFSTAHLVFGSEARAYPLFRLEFILLVWSWLKLQETARSKSIWLIHTITAVALLYTHYLGAIVLAVSGILSLLLCADKKFSFQFILAYTIAALLWLPLLLPAWEVITKRGENSLHFLPEFWHFKYQLVSVWNGDLNYEHFMLLFLCCLTYLLSSKNTARKLHLYIALAGVLNYVTLYFGSQWVWFFSDNYLLFTTLTIYITLGIFAGKAVSKFPVVSYVLLAILLLPYFRQFNPLPKNLTYREVKSSIAAVQQLRQANEPVFLSPTWTALPYTYYAYPAIFKLPENELDSVLYVNKHFKIEQASEIEGRLAGATAFILYLDEYTGTNPIGELPKGFIVKDSILIPEVYLVLYCALDSNLLSTSSADTVLN